ncbi:MAG: lysophospholipid acyltransferase family protein [Ktedonobacterales bacterium]
MVKYWLFRLAAAILPRIPLWIARPVAVALGTLLWAVAGETRRRTIRNLRHIPSLAEHPDRLRATSRGVFQRMTLNYLDFFRGRFQSDEEVKRGWTIDGLDGFEQALALGRGVIIISGHFGNWEFAASRMGLIAGSAVTPAEHMRPERLFALFCALRAHHGVRIIAADSRDSLREMLSVLKQGGIVIILSDRYVMGASAEVPLFGAPAKLPTSAYTLALRGDVPLMAAFTWSEGPERSHGLFVPVRVSDARVRTSSASGPATATRTRGDARVGELQGRFLRAMESVIAAHPEQWVSALMSVWEAN